MRDGPVAHNGIGRTRRRELGCIFGMVEMDGGGRICSDAWWRRLVSQRLNGTILCPGSPSGLTNHHHYAIYELFLSRLMYFLCFLLEYFN